MAASAISGTRRAFKELVDGTLRVQIDIDPEHRRDFLRLFPDIDMRIALAPLKAGAKSAIPEDVKGGELARFAGMLCSDPDFQGWLESIISRTLKLSSCGIEDDEERTAVRVRDICEVASRAELDHNAAAAERFHDRIRKPWQAFCATGKP